ncbi:MAG TPA: thiamine pyrophosphate-dependent dehydrogenase E1 component subunit alpha [Gemmatimonadaceae bacterium]|nr:thiamine pyrophosphate-dependent dehydrogenase E1 component subunit alpha [Gemmatimonadaceae bacterium]
MKRYAAFEPAEYVAWERDGVLVEEYRATLERDADRARVIAQLTPEQLLDLYRGLVRNRLTDISLKRMVRQGVISKAWLGTGEEATTIGPVHALRRPRARSARRVDGASPSNGASSRRDDGVSANDLATYDGDIAAPMIRNAGACHEMGMPVADILRAYMGTFDSPSHGRDGHCGDLSKGVLPPISNIGDIVPVVTGVALSFRMRGSEAVALTWIGDGSTKAGVTHEALNFAAVRRAPAIFIIQNNQVALGTRLDQHHVAAGGRGFADWPKAYGMWGGVFDGNNVLDAYALTALAVERCRRGDGPALLVAETFRMGGHATHDEAEARHTFAPELFAAWGRRDPIALYEEHLVECGVARETLDAIEAEVEQEVERAEAEALESRHERMPPPASAVDGVYADASGTPRTS